MVAYAVGMDDADGADRQSNGFGATAGMDGHGDALDGACRWILMEALVGCLDLLDLAVGCVELLDRLRDGPRHLKEF